MSNEELIKKYEDVSVKQVILLKEIITRHLNRELIGSDWEKVREIASIMGANIFDTISDKGIDKKTLKDSIENVVNMCTDKNR